jgi:hypothetical protein
MLLVVLSTVIAVGRVECTKPMIMVDELVGSEMETLFAVEEKEKKKRVEQVCVCNLNRTFGMHAAR